MIVQAAGGLCNRLRVVLSWHSEDPSARFVWKRDGEIAGATFLDVFEPVDWLTWASQDERADVVTCDPCPDARVGWERDYRALTLRPYWQSEWGRLREMRPYSAIHVRRTDHLEYARSLGNETYASEFVEWLGRSKLRVFVASDSHSAQKEARGWVDQCGRASFHSCAIKSHAYENMGGRRNTELGYAAVDLFTCAGAVEFMGTRESSFSNCVTMLRSMGGWWA